MEKSAFIGIHNYKYCDITKIPPILITKKSKYLMFYITFLERNINCSTHSGLRQLLFSVTILPPLLNIHSDATLDVQMHKYFLAKIDRRGILDDSCFQNFRGHISV